MAEEIIKFYMNGQWKLPSTNGYSPEIALEFLTSETDKGLPRTRANFRSQPKTISAPYDLMDRRDLQVFFQFYYGSIRSGQKKFIAMLDIGSGLEECVCQLISPPSFGSYTGFAAIVTMSMEVVSYG